MAKVTITPRLKDVEKKILRNWKKSSKKSIKKLILERISRGLSPIGGQGRFKTYAASYKSQIRRGRFSSFSKRVNPVNLKITGKMLRSIKVKISGNSLFVWFTDKKAKWHNKGTAAIPKRPIIPVNNQQFAVPIRKAMEKDLEKIIKKAFN